MGEAKRKRAAELAALRRLRQRLFLIRLDPSMDIKKPCITVDPIVALRMRVESMTDEQRVTMAKRLSSMVDAVPLDDDEKRAVIQETGIEPKRLATRLRARVADIALIIR